MNDIIPNVKLPTLAELGLLTPVEEAIAYEAIKAHRVKQMKRLLYEQWMSAVVDHFGEEHDSVSYDRANGRIFVGLPSRKLNVEVPSKIASFYWAWERYRGA